jgi:predicted nucleic acid-binding protein
LSFFVDANILIYSAVESEYRRPCLEILEAVACGDAPGRISTAALEEVWYVELAGRVGDLRGLAEHGYSIFSPLLPVTDDDFHMALTLDAPAIGPNNRLHVAACIAHGIEVIVSADSEFDEVSGIRRVDPLDVRARRRLLRAGSPDTAGYLGRR